MIVKTTTTNYPFYQSLRFRFGLLFGVVFLLFLLGVIFFLYKNVKTNLGKSFDSKLQSSATVVLQKTEISPLIIPLPQNNERFLLTYNNTKKTDTLFNNLHVATASYLPKTKQTTNNWRTTQLTRTLETGGIITINYSLPSTDLDTSIKQLQLLLFIYIPTAFLISLFTGYFLSGFLLKPIRHIVANANKTDLQTAINLLPEPVNKDELHQLTVALNRMLSRIQKQALQQNAFFASASHELRTPLSNMLTQLQTLETKNVSAEILALLQNQTSDVQRLKKTVNDFLLLSQIKSDNITINSTPVNVYECCIDCAETLYAKAAQNHQTFKVTCEPAEEEFVALVDRNHLLIVVNNLLENAIKYGLANAAINIEVAKTLTALTLTISNSTNAIIPNVQELTNEFYRQDIYKEGVGLGLWIVDQLMQRNNCSFHLGLVNKTFSASVVMPL